MSTTKNIIRTVYLYLFALVGLVLTIIGGVIIVNNLLKTYVFKDADYRYDSYYVSEPMSFDSKFGTTINSDLKITKEALEKIKLKEENSSITTKQLTEEQLEVINTWLSDYEKWSNSEKVRQEKEAREKREKERAEKERVANIKKNAELQFEDKAWIFLGNWFIIPGAVGLWMFFKYRNEGFTKKSNAVCSLTLVSFVVLIILAVIIAVSQEAGRSRY